MSDKVILQCHPSVNNGPNTRHFFSQSSQMRDICQPPDDYPPTIQKTVDPADEIHRSGMDRPIRAAYI